MDLIIVESPSKAKTISKYLKGKYKVDASAGHVRDLPERTLAIKIDENFEPRYEITPSKKEIISKLSADAKKADKVYLATDPDREGEAISWHLATVLGLDENEDNRIEFNEISQKAIENALLHPRKINHNLVDAQQARRVLDRLVGYKLSPLVSKRIQSGLSAGRVQSVALRLIVDREREIQVFKPDEYWTFTADLAPKGDGNSFKASYTLKKIGQSYFEEDALKIENALSGAVYTVTKVKTAEQKSHAPAPFTTSSLQQDASTKLGLTAPETMLVAQHLYEGMDVGGDHVAFISYIRTDSVRISDEARYMAQSFIKDTYGEQYLPDKPNIYKGKKNIQDAHEAIRPINLSVTPESVKGVLDKKHYSVYKLIYDRFVASQMAQAVYNTVQADIEAAGYTFKASGKAVKFAGYTVLYDEPKAEDEEENKKMLPALEEGEILDLKKLSKEQKFTRPPSRYTDASLVKTMDEKGIGRPSTYASIISVLNKRHYVTKDGKAMVPTDVAYKITDLLLKYFDDVMDIGFTAKMEDELDKIEDGGEDWHSVISAFYPGFSEKLAAAKQDGEEITDVICSKCGSPMIRKQGKYGPYLACSAFPKCRNIISETPLESTDKICPECGAPMVVKIGKYGKFLSCSNYPKCKKVMSLDEPKEPARVMPCECGGTFVEKSGKYGKYAECDKCHKKINLTPSGEPVKELADGVCPICGKSVKLLRSKSGKKTFWGCSGYPECSFMSWDMPTGDKCPVCGEYLVMKDGKIKCSSKTCKYKIDAKTDEDKD